VKYQYEKKAKAHHITRRFPTLLPMSRRLRGKQRATFSAEALKGMNVVNRGNVS